MLISAKKKVFFLKSSKCLLRLFITSYKVSLKKKEFFNVMGKKLKVFLLKKKENGIVFLPKKLKYELDEEYEK